MLLQIDFALEDPVVIRGRIGTDDEAHGGLQSMGAEALSKRGREQARAL